MAKREVTFACKIDFNVKAIVVSENVDGKDYHNVGISSIHDSKTGRKIEGILASSLNLDELREIAVKLAAIPSQALLFEEAQPCKECGAVHGAGENKLCSM